MRRKEIEATIRNCRDQRSGVLAREDGRALRGFLSFEMVETSVNFADSKEGKNI